MRFSGLQPTVSLEGARKGEAILSRSAERKNREKLAWSKSGSVPKLTQVGEESILTVLERTVLKELGNLTP